MNQKISPIIKPDEFRFGILSLILFFTISIIQAQNKPCISATTNGGFEQPLVTTCWTDFNQTTVPDWNTTEGDGMIEMWDGACMGVPAYSGNQFAELNANAVSSLYIDICTPCPNTVNWSFAHRGRLGVDVCDLEAGPPGGPYTTIGTFTDGNAAWGFYTGTYNVPVGQTVTTFVFVSVSSAGGDPTFGNFLDAVDFNFSGAPTILKTSIPTCIGNSTGSATITPLGGAPPYTYLWSNGSIDSTIIGLNAGVYSVTITDGSGCSGIDTITVNGVPAPVPHFSSTSVCLNNPTVFTDLSAGAATHWNWKFGDGTFASSQNPSHTYNNSGNYNATLIATNNFGCKDSIQQPVTVNPLPAANFSSTIVCYSDSTCFTDSSTISNGSTAAWNWIFNDPASGINDSSNAHSPCHVFTSPANTSYHVKLIVTSLSGCQGTVTLPVVFHAPPVAAFISTTVCLNSISGFTDASTSTDGAINSWGWNFGDGSPHAVVQDPTHIYSASGTYNVMLSVKTIFGCGPVDTIQPITVNPKPVALFSDSAKGCVPVCAIFYDSSSTQSGAITEWHWSFTGGTPLFADAKNPSICFNVPGTYDVSLIATNTYGCKDTLLMPNYVHAFPWPIADFSVSPDQASIHDPIFNFGDTWSPDVVKWYWDFGDGSSIDSSNNSPVHSYAGSATDNDYYSYKIGIRVKTIHGCWDTISKTIEILPEFTFYIANTFTPNGDNINDVFYGKGMGIKEYKIMIFDRWGNLIWNCKYQGKNTDWDNSGQEGMASACKWDGRANNGSEVAQQDVYVWKVELTDVFNKLHDYIGTVILVK